MVELGDHNQMNETREDEEVNTSSERSKHARIEEDSDDDLVRALFQSLKKTSTPDEESSSGSSKNSAHELLSKKDPEGVILPADSLELLDLPGPSNR